MSLARREAIIAIARAFGVPIIEDDAYGMLAHHAPPPLAALAPDIVFHIASLAKCLSPALRIAYLVAPDTYSAVRVGGAVRAVASMASPLTAAIATRWIEDGTAGAVLGAIRKESIARLQIAADVLSPLDIPVNQEGLHLWLTLPARWSRAEFAARLRTVGIGVVGSDAFALENPPEAVRLGLGAPGTREELRSSLQSVVHLLGESPIAFSTVV
jgi:DNA-binding transcriptional MocR family regulator